MKRPLLWAIVWFALGEVLAINFSREQQAGVLVCALACCVFVKKIHWPKLWLLVCILGCMNVHLRRESFEYEGCRIKETGIVRAIEEKDNDGRIVYNLEVEIIDRTNDDSYRVILYGCEGKYRLGNIVKVEGELSVFEEKRNPGVFDMRRYNLAKGIVYYMYADEVRILDSSYNHFRQTLYNVKQEGLKRLDTLTGTDVSGLYKGILLGDKADIDVRTKLAFQITSLMHILSLSGLHLSLISGCVFKIIRRISGSVYIAAPVTMLVLYMYGMMTGFGVATVRAFIMIVIAMFGEICGLDYDILTADGITLLMLLLINPYKIYDMGMWLSISAIVGVYAGNNAYRQLFSRIKVKLSKKKKLIVEGALQSFAVAVGINVVTFPITILIYYQFCPYSLILNLIVIPLMSVVVICGMSGLLTVSYLSTFTMLLGKTVIRPGELILRLYCFLCDKTVGIPGYVINTGKPKAMQVIIYYLAIWIMYELIFDKTINLKLISRMKQGMRRIIAGVTGALAVMIITAVALMNNSEKVIFLDVGQGDAIAVHTEDGVNICIDGGSSGNSKVGRYILIPALKSMQMSHIDYWFISHMDEDHISGLIEILELGRLSGIHISRIVLSENIGQNENYYRICELAKQNEIPIVYMSYGDSIYSDAFIVKSCNEVYGKIYDENQASLALLYSSARFNILFTGDMDSEALENMVSNSVYCQMNEDEKTKILKVPHHGSRNSASRVFYETGSFDEAVISCEENGRYGHPHEEILELLQDYDIAVRRTDKEGAIIIQ